jgi:hypothetical protein
MIKKMMQIEFPKASLKLYSSFSGIVLSDAT